MTAKATPRFTLSLSLGIAGVLLMLAALAPTAPADDAAPPGEGEVRVGNLIYAGDKTGVCFADGFLDTVARESDVKLHRAFAAVRLDSDALFEHPFVVMTGEGGFTLSDTEKQNLKAYLERGGFVLASAGCSNAAWAKSFEAAIAELFGEEAMHPLELDHPLFHSLHDIDRIDVRKSRGGPAAIHGLTLDGALRVVYSPLGLNDTANAGKGCCCCGGNEVRNARIINANILAHALTH